MDSRPDSGTGDSNGRVPRTSSGCQLVLWALAILFTFAVFGALLAGLVLLLGPGDGLGRPAGITVLLAYAAFALTCIFGTLVAWFIIAIKQKKSDASRGLSERRQTGVEPDTLADIFPGGASSNNREATEYAQFDLVTNQSIAPPQPPKDGTDSNQARPKISPEESRDIGRHYSKKEAASQTQFHPDELNGSTGQHDDASPRHIQRESYKKHDSPLSSAAVKNAKSTTGSAQKDKQGTTTSRCQYGKRRGYCAICDWDAYKDMQGRWEED